MAPNHGVIGHRYVEGMETPDPDFSTRLARRVPTHTELLKRAEVAEQALADANKVISDLKKRISDHACQVARAGCVCHGFGPCDLCGCSG